MPGLQGPIRRAKRSVVKIESDFGVGSGVIYDVRRKLAYILTTYDVIQGNPANLRVTAGDFHKLPATVLPIDNRTTLAELTVFLGRLQPAQFETREVRQGDEVFVLGYPEGAVPTSATAAPGIVSAIGPHPNHPAKTLIQTNAPINQGDIGGPLFTRNGKIAGIIAFQEDTRPGGGRAEGLGFAIPAPLIIDYLASIGRIQPPITNEPSQQPSRASVSAIAHSSTQSLAERIDEWKRSVVHIICENGSGSGVLSHVDSDKAFVITNAHVVNGADNVIVVANDDKQYAAEVYWKDASPDIAVLAISGDHFYPARFAEPDALEQGMEIIVLGYPGGRVVQGAASSTNGIVSAIGPHPYYPHGNIVQTSAEINPGNSGGPMFSLSGEVVAIATFKQRQSGSRPGHHLGFGIPSATVRQLLPTHLSKGI